MYHPTTRVLTILELLQAHGTLNGAELATRLEVDRRTVRKYILMLQDLGIPIETTRGPTGGYSLRPGFKLPPLMLTDDEAVAVTLSLILARRHGMPGEAPALEGALAKIQRVLPEGLRQRLQALEATVAFVPAPTTVQLPSEFLLLCSAAVARQQRVQLTYQSQGEQTVRGVDPYGIVTHYNLWYLVGWCHLRQDIRLFRLDRIVAASMEAVTFTCLSDFDSLAVVLESLALTPRGWPAAILLETTLAEAQQRIPPGMAVFELGIGFTQPGEMAGDLFLNLLRNGCRFDDPTKLTAKFTDAISVFHREQRYLIKVFMNHRRFFDDSLKSCRRNTKAVRYVDACNPGKLPQVRTFPPNHHTFCFVNVLQTKHIGTHRFTSFSHSLFANAAALLYFLATAHGTA